MELKRIVSLANAKVRLQFLAMERSLRATGCDLPLLVIPYDDTRFPLPENAQWIENEELFALIAETAALKMCRKYLAFTLDHSAYFDSDIIHIRDPRDWLEPLPDNLFVIADTEWSKARWTFTAETRVRYESKTTLWLLDNFNAGFFAHAKPAATIALIRKFLTDPLNRNLARGKVPSGGEQESSNFLVHLGGLEVVNLCLPPFRMESTMACDYPEDFEPILRRANPPAFVHYAGSGRNLDAPVARLIFDHLTASEASEMKAEFDKRMRQEKKNGRWPLWARMAKRILPLVDPRFCIQWSEEQKRGD
jgi:hypothetical protein